MTNCVACLPSGSPSKAPSMQLWLRPDASPMPWLRARTGGAGYGPSLHLSMPLANWRADLLLTCSPGVVADACSARNLTELARGR